MCSNEILKKSLEPLKITDIFHELIACYCDIVDELLFLVCSTEFFYRQAQFIILFILKITFLLHRVSSIRITQDKRQTLFPLYGNLSDTFMDYILFSSNFYLSSLVFLCPMLSGNNIYVNSSTFIVTRFYINTFEMDVRKYQSTFLIIFCTLLKTYMYI